MAVITTFASIGREDIALVGGKAANLGELTHAGIAVPPGFVVTTTAYAQTVDAHGLASRIAAIVTATDPDDLASTERAAAEIADLLHATPVPSEIAEQIGSAYRDLRPDDGPVAVRSSATAEDLEDASFAGQQDTYLNIRGTDAVIAAVRDCWVSLWTPRAIAYRRERDIDPETVRLAVVVQRLVDATSAGVAFTANPTTGRRDEIVVSAAWGLGESVVSGSVTTDDVVLRIDGDRLTLRSRTVADKEVETVRTETGTAEIPVAADRRRAVVLDDDAVLELAQLCRRIATHYGRPMDIEWAREPGGGFAIVQARPITALPDPIGDAPSSWPVEHSSDMYARTSIVEMMPDPLTPLFGDMVRPAVEASVAAVLQDYLGTDLTGEDLSFPTVNGYAYYRYSRRTLLHLTIDALPALPGLFSGDRLDPHRRWREESLPAYQAVVDRWRSRDPRPLAAIELLDGVAELLLAACTYYTTVQAIIPVAASSEVAFTRLYDSLARRDGDPPATTFVLGMDSSALAADRELFDLARWVAERPGLLAAVSDGDPRDVVFGAAPRGVRDDVWQPWRQRIAAYLGRYGHTIYNLDFVNPVGADAPGPVLEALVWYAQDPARDPRIRQRRMAQERTDATTDLLARLDPMRRRLFAATLRKTDEYVPVREDALAAVGLAWPTMRALLAELGARLHAAGAIADEDDLYWLRLEELRRCATRLDDDLAVAPIPAVDLDERRMTWRGQRSVTPPQLLPPSRLNDLMATMMPSREDGQDGPVLRGLGASGGRVTAPACVITDPSDFARMRAGDVIVARITTPAYTPLFARAAAVVTDVGGPLSHSSIVAREYGIPAVLGTGVATRRIADGDEITVDGTRGEVVLAGAEQVAEPTPARRRPSPLALLGAGAAVTAAIAVVVRRRRRGRSLRHARRTRPPRGSGR